MSKFTMDVIWGEIELTPLALKFVDVFEFQRMRHMKQLGPCNFVYSCAETSRFAHSLGTYHLARRMCLGLKQKYGVDSRTAELIPIAALYHDIGHGPFSHTFDRITNSHHEERSKSILRHVVKKYNIPVTEDEVEFMCQVIDPDEYHKNTSWQFQIVSGDVDVDRMDYLVRDSNATGVTITLNPRSVLKIIDRVEIKNDRLYYGDSVWYVITDLLESRKYMYERVYLHHTAIRIEKLMIQALARRLRNATKDIDTFLKFSDSVLQDVYLTGTVEEKEHVDKIFTRRFGDI